MKSVVRTRFISLGGASLVVLTGAASLASGDTLVDDFSSTQPGAWPLLVTDLIPDFSHEDGLGGVLGGSRGATIVGDSFDSAGVDFVTANVDPGAGTYTYSATSGAVASASLRYDGGGSGLAADFSGELGLVIDFAEVNALSPLTVEIDISDGVAFNFLVRSVPAGGAQSVLFEYDQFEDGPGLGPVDFSQVHDFTIIIFADRGTEFTITGIRSIPAPASALSLSIGLMGGRRRRRCD